MIDGGSGNDIIRGGDGADNLSGGAGNDTFVLSALTNSTPAAADTIVDFVHGQDRFDFSAIDANTSAKKDQAFAFVAGQTSSVVANSVTWSESGGNTIVQADVNGDTTADIKVVLTGTNLQLTASDFIL